MFDWIGGKWMAEPIVRALIFVGHTMHEITIPSSEDLLNSLSQPKPFIISSGPDSDGVTTRVFLNPESVHSVVIKEKQPTGDIITPTKFGPLRGI